MPARSEAEEITPTGVRFQDEYSFFLRNTPQLSCGRRLLESRNEKTSRLCARLRQFCVHWFLQKELEAPTISRAAGTILRRPCTCFIVGKPPAAFFTSPGSASCIQATC